MRHFTIVPALLAVALIAPHQAHAHAHLTAASPAVGSTVQAAPTEVTITYTEGVEPKFSTIEVLDAAGTRVDTANVHILPDDNKRLSVGVKPLSPGVYKVIWHATAVDTHKTEGDFSFTVGK
jgi:methionine-rich copper-binding protein CopC